MAITNLNKSKIENLPAPSMTISLLVNSLREERIYLHYLRGDMGSVHSACGQRQSKIKKAGRQWVETGDVCTNGSKIYKIT